MAGGERMLCEECKKRPASVHLTKIVNNRKTESHLCEECARKKGELHFSFETNFSIHHLLSGLLNSEAGSGAPSSFPDSEAHCPSCGLSFSDFRQVGRVGCSECYHEFSAQMQPLLRRIHGASKHVGKVPQRAGGQIRLRREIKALREELQTCIRQEEYERAAALRDQIKALEQGEDQGQ